MERLYNWAYSIRRKTYEYEYEGGPFVLVSNLDVNVRKIEIFLVGEGGILKRKRIPIHLWGEIHIYNKYIWQGFIIYLLSKCNGTGGISAQWNRIKEYPQIYDKIA
jgi:hypothetical protein